MFSPPTRIATRFWLSPIGNLLLAAHDHALCGIWFQDQKGIPPWAFSAATADQRPVLDVAIEQLQEYFAGRRHGFDLPMDISFGTPFQQSVWQTLRGIGFGQTRSYGDIARAIGKPQAVRAVGGAVGRNPIGIVLPCHRVVGRDGSMTGYTGGLDRKLALLQLERA